MIPEGMNGNELYRRLQKIGEAARRRGQLRGGARQGQPRDCTLWGSLYSDEGSTKRDPSGPLACNASAARLNRTRFELGENCDADNAVFLSRRIAAPARRKLFGPFPRLTRGSHRRSNG